MNTLPPSSLDFQNLIPEKVSQRNVFRMEDYMVWCASMLRTQDGNCHLWFSRWPKSFGHSAWVTHSEIAYATAPEPDGPYTFHSVALPARGGHHWDAHMTHNPHALEHEGRFYLYYTGTRSPDCWNADKPEPTDIRRWGYRMNQRVGVAVADSPAGPWTRFETPLIDIGANTGEGITATPSVCQRPQGDFLMVFKSQAPGTGNLFELRNFGGGVFHYPALGQHPLGPFKRHGASMVDKRKRFNRHFDFHIDDHLEWFQEDRFYAIVKDHDAPYLTPLGKVLYLLESQDGLHWQTSTHSLVTRFSLDWEEGHREHYERLEMPKLYIENGKPRVLFLAALPQKDPSEHSFNIAIPLHEL